jgi:hypothetical protein
VQAEVSVSFNVLQYVLPNFLLAERLVKFQINDVWEVGSSSRSSRKREVNSIKSSAVAVTKL